MKEGGSQIDLLHSDPRLVSKALRLKQSELNKLQNESLQKSKQIKELESARFWHRQVLMVAILIAGLISWSIYSRHLSEVEIERQYETIRNQISAAYSGDKNAHREVIRELPILTKRRLPKTLNDAVGRSFVPVDTLVVGLEQSSDEVIKVPVYLDAEEGSYILGYLEDDSDLISKREFGDWTQIMLATGFPAWVSGDYLTMIDNNLGQLVDAEQVRLRTHPNLDSSEVIGHVNSGVRLFVTNKQEEWVEVRTPPNFKLWVKTADINNLLDF